VERQKLATLGTIAVLVICLGVIAWFIGLYVISEVFEFD
jgi:hypothetical protein